MPPFWHIATRRRRHTRSKRPVLGRVLGGRGRLGFAASQTASQRHERLPSDGRITNPITFSRRLLFHPRSYLFSICWLALTVTGASERAENMIFFSCGTNQHTHNSCSPHSPPSVLAQTTCPEATRANLKEVLQRTQDDRTRHHVPAGQRGGHEHHPRPYKSVKASVLVNGEGSKTPATAATPPRRSPSR